MTSREVTGPAAAAPGDGRRIVLDGCVLLNLYASRKIADILATLPHPCVVAAYVRDHEALWVGPRRSKTSVDVERVDIAPLVTAGLIEIMELDGEEEIAHFIVLASALDDGEATCGALAHARGLVVATDDRAALAAFSRHDPSIPTCSTASLVKHWAECATIDAASLRRALLDIRERAYFEPSPRDPLQSWWRVSLNEE